MLLRRSRIKAKILVSHHSLTWQRPPTLLEYGLKTPGPNQYQSELSAWETKEAQLEDKQQPAQPKEKGKNNPLTAVTKLPYNLSPDTNYLKFEYLRGQKRWNSGLEQRVRNEANPINRQRWEAEPTGHQGQRSVVSEGGCCRSRGRSLRGRPAQELLPEPASSGFKLSIHIIWDRNSKNLPTTSKIDLAGEGAISLSFLPIKILLFPYIQ